MFTIGIIDRGRTEYWKFLLWTLMHRPHLFVDAIMFTISGYHFRNVYGVGKEANFGKETNIGMEANIGKEANPWEVKISSKKTARVQD